jgi:hypothetical protein
MKIIRLLPKMEKPLNRRLIAYALCGLPIMAKVIGGYAKVR